MRYPIVEQMRIKKHMTEEEVANKLGVCRKTYYNWQVKGGMPQSAVEILMDLFEISAECLLKSKIDRGAIREGKVWK